MSNQLNETPQRQLSPIQSFRRDWESNKAEISKQLPTGVDPDRFMRTTITTVQSNPELLNADRSSLFNACMQAAKDGLLPDGREATIQIYNTKVKGANGQDQWVKMAQYMPMVRGLIKKMYEAGCTKVDGVAVYENDDFTYELGDEPRITHRPYMGSEDPGPVIASYAIVKLENGEIKREVMPRRDIEKVREASKSGNGPGWTTWYDQFAIKAVLKRVYKQVPGKNDEFEKVMDADNNAMGFTFEHKATDAPALVTEESVMRHVDDALGAEPSAADKLKAKLGGSKEAENPEPVTGETITADGEVIPGLQKASSLKPKQTNEEFLAGLEGGE